MYYIGIDLHKQDLVMAVEDERGPVGRARRIACRDVQAIRSAVERWRPFRAVVEASASYRWLYDLLSPQGEVVLAHPLRLRAITAARAKTDRLDAAMLARLLRANLIPAAYVPPARVHPSGGHEHRGGISKQGSRWLRWMLVQAAMKLVRRDERLANFYQRVRKRAGRNVARVAVARKLAGICWVRLRAWRRARAAAPAATRSARAALFPFLRGLPRRMTIFESLLTLLALAMRLSFD